MDNQWNIPEYNAYIQQAAQQQDQQQQQQHQLQTLEPPPAKRQRVEHSDDSSDEGSDDDNGSSVATSPAPTSDTLGYPQGGPLAHSTPIMPRPDLSSQPSQMAPDFSQFVPMMQQQWPQAYNPYQAGPFPGFPYPQHPGQPQAALNSYGPIMMPFPGGPAPAPAMGLINTPSPGSGTSDEDSGNASLFNANDDPHSQTFTTVPGRLSLLGSNKKLTVTLAEINRRINAPECLNQSILSAILRKAKNKDGGNKLNADLKRFNITLTQGRRKSAPNSAFTALVEKESLTLVQDFHTLSDKYFPGSSMAYEFLKCIQNAKDYNDKLAYLQCTLATVAYFINILCLDNSPVADLPHDLPLRMHPESQKDFTHFSLLTHGFGSKAHWVSWTTLGKTTKVVYDAMIDPQGFCTKIGRPLPPRLMGIPTAAQLSSQTPQFQQQAFPGYPQQMPPGPHHNPSNS